MTGRRLEKLDWYPTVCRPGDLQGEGALSLLGKPDLPLATILVRETAQNSWDARLDDERVRYTIHARTLSAEQLRVLREVVFPQGGKGTRLRESLQRPRLEVLEISDRGTKGLGGPVRNDRPVKSGEVSDYIDFVLNVGAQPSKTFAGGTYGFGKSIAYLVSRAHTVVIWSRCRRGRGFEHRFIASAFGESFPADGRQYTGRQWWGRERGRDVIEPVTGEAARELGSILFETGMAKAETGTSLLIIDPDVGHGGSPSPTRLERIATECAEAVLWHLWPKMVPPPGKSESSMEIRVLHEGGEVPVPDPSSHPVLRGFVDALQAVRAAQDGGDPPSIAASVPIELLRPKTTLGRLAIVVTPARPEEPGAGATDAGEPDPDGEVADGIRPFEGPARHVALLRYGPELIVRYLPMGAGREGAHACGVFRCAREHDHRFASAEPPAHDDWLPASVADKSDRRHVNVALRRIRDEWRDRFRLDSGPVDPEGILPAGRLGLRLADLVPGLGGHAAGPDTGPRPGPGGGSRKPTGRAGSGGVTVHEPFIERVADGRTRALVHLEVVDGVRPLRLVAHAAAGYDGGSDREVVDDTAILGFLPGHRESSEGGPPPLAGTELVLGPDDPGRWTAVVEFPTDLALDLRLSAVPPATAPAGAGES